ncbi:MAG: hypothetical protein NTU98_08035 [Bacteroidetes bacterium]|nr:hypothetical protein [Bacteroidota bacterium]
MKTYLKSILPQLRNYSLTLDKTSILIDKPWALIDEEYELQKLIFKKDKELILSKNGQVSIGKWDYFPQAKSLLIDRKTDIILCNEQFIDEGILILKLDGTENRFFILANENIVPDLNAFRYLTELRYQKLNIATKELSNGKILEIQRWQNYDTITIENRVFFEGEEVQEGKYYYKTGEIALLVKSGKIADIYYIRKYKMKDGLMLTVEQSYYDYRSVGDLVLINNQPAPDGTYKLGFIKKIKVKNGRII